MLSSATHPLIGVDPNIRSGRPCVVGTRISVSYVLGWLGNGMSMAEIIQNFPELTPELIQACQRYAADCVVPYTEAFGRGPDFRVSYRLFTDEEGGRKTPAYQHIRWDFCYEDKAMPAGNWMVYPEFLDPDGSIIPTGPFAPFGQAAMFCLSTNRQAPHYAYIRPGVRGYFMEGPRRVGVCEVVEVLGLRQNLTNGPSS